MAGSSSAIDAKASLARRLGRAVASDPAAQLEARAGPAPDAAPSIVAAPPGNSV
jgi:hypothetical protein